MGKKRRIERLEAVWPPRPAPARSLDLGRLADEERAEWLDLFARYGSYRLPDGRLDLSYLSDEDLERMTTLVRRMAELGDETGR